MRKTLSYSSLAVAALVVAVLFVTAKDYTQLGLGILLYPVLVYLVMKAFPRTQKGPEITVQISKEPTPQPMAVQEAKPVEEEKATVGVTDTDKRVFLKLIGAAGLSFFLFSLLRGKAGSLFGGKTGPEGPTMLEDTTGTKIDPAERQPTDGLQISEIDDSEIAYYGFTNKDGAWLIMKEDTDSSSFRYAKGDSQFPDSWAKREQLNYDYFHNAY